MIPATNLKGVTASGFFTGTFSGDGRGLTNINDFAGDAGGATNLQTSNLVGVIPATNLTGVTASGVFTGAFSGNGEGLTNINNFSGNAGGATNLQATNLVGVIPATNLSGVISSGVFTGTFLGDGGGLTNINFPVSPIVSAWGDSLTAGTGGNGSSYPGFLAQLASVPVINNGFSGDTSTQIRARFMAAPNQWANLTIIWSGRNNFLDPATVECDIAAMVFVLGHQNYLVLSVLNMNIEPIGTTNYVAITNLNHDLSVIYGTHYVDVRSWLDSTNALAYLGIAPSAQDAADIINDVTPGSLRSDGIHLNSVGYSAVAWEIYTNWFAGAQIVKLIGNSLATYSSIGSQSPGVVHATLLNMGNHNLSLTGDGAGFQSDASLIPSVANTSDLGTASLPWRNGFFSAVGAQAVSIGGRWLTLTGDGKSFVSDASIVPAYPVHDLGATDTPWRNGYFFGAVSAQTVVINGSTILNGVGSPQNVVTGSPGDIYMNLSGGAGQTMWVKETGVRTTTGWVAK